VVQLRSATAKCTWNHFNHAICTSTGPHNACPVSSQVNHTCCHSQDLGQQNWVHKCHKTCVFRNQIHQSATTNTSQSILTASPLHLPYLGRVARARTCCSSLLRHGARLAALEAGSVVLRLTAHLLTRMQHLQLHHLVGHLRSPCMVPLDEAQLEYVKAQYRPVLTRNF